LDYHYNDNKNLIININVNIININNINNINNITMGLGKKLGQRNQETVEALSRAKAPVSVEGYNSNNLNLPSTPSMTSSDIKEINELKSGVDKEFGSVSRLGDLFRPNVPKGSDTDRQLINELVVAKMWRIIHLRKLQNFYTQDSLQELVNRACIHDYRLLQRNWSIATIDMTVDLAVLGLYDIVLFGDDSSSMNIEEPSEDNLSRWQLLKEVIKTLSFWSTLMDSDGVVVRFFNSNVEGNNLSSADDVEGLFRRVRAKGSTPMGEQLHAKILNQFVYQMLDSKELQKPILIITVTDGAPNSKIEVIKAITECYNKCRQSCYGEHAVAFSFAQIGSSSDATAWLGEIDSDRVIGHLIDCTSEFQIEKAECERTYSGIDFTEATWLVKLMIGPIDPEYDNFDECSSSISCSSNAPPPYYQ
jgi:hypothetical protein